MGRALCACVLVWCPCAWTCWPVQRADLDLEPYRLLRHRDHERADVTPDVEQDGALPGPCVLGVASWPHDAAVVPGLVW